MSTEPTKTPRTDALCAAQFRSNLPHLHRVLQLEDHARQLEIELGECVVLMERALAVLQEMPGITLIPDES